MEIDKKIEKFITSHHVLTLATSTTDGHPYCCNIFYAYNKQEGAFIFTSDDHTHHAQMMSNNPRVAASIVLETRIVGKVQGLQITGEVKRAVDGDKALYIKRFPYAAVADLQLWRMEADFMKLTDNTLGFGKKLIWQK
ncbi:MAG: pyridoxamine 5'-phosphate oxidase family protein [Alistipes sp.]|nr:pyridoxamine 5'-phosphate oxidase family protein [Alistipes sp.]MBR2332182.1 pyridoxamine 5'-phosphate oxidase family protein [Alistipes sp.]